MNTTEHQYLRPPAAAAYIGKSVSTLGKMRMRGDGPAYIKVGRNVIYDRPDLDAYMAARRRSSTSEEAA